MYIYIYIDVDQYGFVYRYNSTCQSIQWTRVQLVVESFSWKNAPIENIAPPKKKKLETCERKQRLDPFISGETHGSSSGWGCDLDHGNTGKNTTWKIILSRTDSQFLSLQIWDCCRDLSHFASTHIQNTRALFLMASLQYFSYAHIFLPLGFQPFTNNTTSSSMNPALIGKKLRSQISTLPYSHPDTRETLIFLLLRCARLETLGVAK